MPPPIDTSRDLVFGILALQNGLIDQGAVRGVRRVES